MPNCLKSIFGRRPKAAPEEPKPADEAERPSKGLKRGRSEENDVIDFILGKIREKDSFDVQKALGTVFQRSAYDDLPKERRAEAKKNGMKAAMDGAIAEDAALARGVVTGKAGSAANLTGPVQRYGVNEHVMRHFSNRGFISWPTCAIVSQHEIVNNACSIPPQDAISHGYELVCSSDSHTHDEEHDKKEEMFLPKLRKFASAHGMNDICVQLTFKKKVFGVGLALPRVEGADYDKPYNPDGIKKGSFKGISVIDPYWLTYEFNEDALQDPTSSTFYDPEYYYAPNGKKIHKSWIIKVVNSHLPDVLKPTYYYGGIPLTQMLYERVFCADKVANEAPLLAMTKRLLIADANVEDMISNPSHVQKLMKVINYFRDNFSIFFKKPGTNVQQVDTALGEFNQLIMTQYQLICCIAQMPATKLLKVTPTGFQSTGEHELKDYNQSLLDIQENDFRPLLERYYEILLRSEYPNRQDLSVDIVFNPLDVPTREENIKASQQTAQTLQIYINSGVITIQEARKAARKDKLGLLSDLPLEVPEILIKMQDAKDPAKAAAIKQQAMGGATPQGGDDGGVPQGEVPQEGKETIPNYSEAFTRAVHRAQAIAEGKDPNEIDGGKWREGGANPQGGDNAAPQQGGDNPQPQGGQNPEPKHLDAFAAAVQKARAATQDKAIAFDEADKQAVFDEFMRIVQGGM